MPLPEDDEYICMVKQNGKPEFATPEDAIKFFKLVGETIFNNLDKESEKLIDCVECENNIENCTCNIEDEFNENEEDEFSDAY